MKKPTYFYFRSATFLNDVRGMSMAARGAMVTLVAEMYQRWQPERDPFPSLPDDKALLQRMCGGAKNWHRVSEDVLQKFTRQDGKLLSPWLNDEVQRLSEYWKADGEKQEKKTKKEKPAAAINAQKTPAAPEAAARSWDEAPAPDGDVLVYGLQGFRAVGWAEMAGLLAHPTKLREGGCTLWKVTGTKTEQSAVTVLKSRKGFAFRLDNGQTVTADS
jgi:uncharacterized protein YdaU (DUF1376 family)